MLYSEDEFIGQQPAVLTPEAVLNSRTRAAFDIATRVVDNVAATYGGAAVAQGYSSIRPYFWVTDRSVREKIAKIVFPFSVKHWSRNLPEGAEPLPANNSNLPELYTPIIFGFAFLLLASAFRGMARQFSYENFSLLSLKVFTYVLFIVFLTKGLFFVLAIPGTAPLLTLLADLGVITVHLTLVTLVSWNTWLKILMEGYCVAALFLWTIKVLNPRLVIQGTSLNTSQTYCFLGVAVVQDAALIFLASLI
jgi:hypothetical protein